MEKTTLFCLNGMRHQFGGEQTAANEYIALMGDGAAVELVKEAGNIYDDDAVMVYHDGRRIGRIAADDSRQLRTMMGGGDAMRARFVGKINDKQCGIVVDGYCGGRTGRDSLEDFDAVAGRGAMMAKEVNEAVMDGTLLRYHLSHDSGVPSRAMMRVLDRFVAMADSSLCGELHALRVSLADLCLLGGEVLHPYGARLCRIASDMGNDSHVVEVLRRDWATACCQGAPMPKLTADEARRMLATLPFDIIEDVGDTLALAKKLLYNPCNQRALSKILMVVAALRGDGKMPDTSVARADEAMLKELQRFFRGSREDAERFLRDIDGARPVDITRLVKRCVKSGHLLEEYSHRPLWTLLHSHGMYAPTETNWNKQII